MIKYIGQSERAGINAGAPIAPSVPENRKKNLCRKFTQSRSVGMGVVILLIQCRDDENRVQCAFFMYIYIYILCLLSSAPAVRGKKSFLFRLLFYYARNKLAYNFSVLISLLSFC